MDWKRIGRLLVCLVLVVCMLVNISPIRANAALEWALLPVAALVVTIAVTSALGVSGTEGWLEDTASDTYTVMNRCINWLKENTNHIQIDPLTNEEKILCYATGNPDLPYMVSQQLAEDIRSFLWDDEVVFSITSEPLPEDLINPSGIEYWQSYYANFPYHLIISKVYEGGLYWTFMASMSPFVITSDSSYYFIENTDGSKIRSENSRTGNSSASASFSTSLDAVFTYAGAGYDDVYESSYDITLSFIAGSDVDFTTGYPDWSAGASSVPSSIAGTSDDVPVVPIGIGNTPEDTVGISQTGQWSGASTYVDTSTDTDTGTDTESGSGTGTGTGSGSTSVTVDMSGVITGLEDQTAQLGVWLGEVITGIQSIPQAIKQVLVDVFVPAEDYISVKVDALRAKFPFIDSVIATGEFIRDSVSGASGPPAIYVDLGLATSGNYGSQKVLLTDFAWYAKYKPTVDTLLSAALWAFFGWRVFLKLPGIISGESGYIGEVAAHKEKMDKIRSGPPGKR